MILSILQESFDDIFKSNTFSIRDINSNENYRPVFIILTYTGTLFSKLVKWFTNDTYTHASISFDSSMSNMISFNRNGDGMVTEDLSKFAKNGRENVAKYSIYVYMANKEEYNSMKRFINNIKAKLSNFKYNMLGALRLIPNQRLFGKESTIADKYFCSEFVASVLDSGNKELLNKPSYMFRPNMLSKIKNIIFLKRGFVKNFNPSEIHSILSDKLSSKYNFDNLDNR